MAQNTETPTETLAAATDKSALPIRRLTLVGTFDKSAGPSALIRTPDGNIRMVTTGDSIGAATVTAIEMGTVHLAFGTRTTRLTLPEG